MKLTSSSSVFACAWAACALVMAAEVWWLAEARAAAEISARKIDVQRAELRALLQFSPAPTGENAAAIAVELAATQRELATRLAALRAGPEAERIRQSKPPGTRAEAFFDLAGFVERTRESAQTHGVEVRPEAARFGFVTYSNSAPDDIQITAVFRQRQIVECLLEPLLQAKPLALLAVKRERPRTEAERAGAATGSEVSRRAATPSGASDFFEIDPRLSVRTPEAVDAMAFQVSFVGQTATLRVFLNDLARFKLPVLVRDVAVEPLPMNAAVRRRGSRDASVASEASYVLTAETAPPSQRGPSESADAVPLVPKPFSKFTVTVEYVELISSSEASGRGI